MSQIQPRQSEKPSGIVSGGGPTIPFGPRPPAKPPGSTKLVLVALGLALLAVILTNLYIKAVRDRVEASSFEVYVLTQPVSPGDPLGYAQVKRLLVPDTTEFRNTFNALGRIDKPELDNHVLSKDPLLRGGNTNDLLTKSFFHAPDAADQYQIPPGKRLVSLPVDSRRLPGELYKQMRVDILAAFNSGTNVPSVLPVMENVLVVGVGSHTLPNDKDADTARNRPAGGYRTISIEVTPDEAASLETIQRIMLGDFMILLRSPNDESADEIKAGGINEAVLDLIHKRAKEPTRRN